jgi:hypothetical protein
MVAEERRDTFVHDAVTMTEKFENRGHFELISGRREKSVHY